MKLQHYLVAALLAGVSFGSLQAQQPYGGCWHPDDIKNWSPASDPDAKYNRARVPLAARFKEPQLMKANANQYYEGQVCNASILFHMCSMSPSQGANNFTGYQPTYWQYMDKLVHWAGSASEGIIIPPPAGSIDAAHAQGVKVLGQIFFPPDYYGGKQEWVRQMLTVEGGKYIYAVKLYEIAKYLGFDGWFINEETGGGSNDEWVAFIKDFNAAADAAGDTHMEIQWYNASSTPNTAILKSHINTSQFLEYGSAKDWRQYAESYGCTPEQVFGKVYQGVQCVSGGLTGWNRYIEGAFPASGHVGSLDLFCPEERAWKDNVKDLLGTADDNGSKAYAAIEKTFANEEKAWVNLAGDPSDISSTSWRGLSGAVLERSVIDAMPFVSNMCVGVGKHRFVNGQKISTQDWYHSGVQSILPTWRWWIENRGDIKVTIDWDDAYNHGSSFKFTGIAAGNHLVRLYKTMIPVASGATVSVAYKGTAAPVLALSTESSVNPDVTLNAASTAVSNGWNVATYDLSSVAGKTVYMIGLDLNGVGETFALGQLAVLPAGYAPAATAIRNAVVESNLGEAKGDVRVNWDFDWSDDFDHFDIYTSDFNGVRKLVGQTRGEGFYIPGIVRQGTENSIDIEIIPVMKDGKQQASTKLTANYPQATAPKVSFKLSKSYLKVGETATITANGTGNPSSWQWTLPAGLELSEGSLTSNVITVKANTVGRHKVSVSSTNAIGTSNTDSELLDVYDEAGVAQVQNVLLKKKVVSYSGSTNSTETPANLIDGVTNPSSTSAKWCNVSPTNWVILDTEGLFRIYGFKIYDCKAGPENAENIKSYTIEVSQDGNNWTKVVDEENREGDNIKEDYIAPVRARYIRFSPTVSGTLRVWEFEAYGVDDVHTVLTTETPEMRIEAGETEDLVVSYDLNGDQREADFELKVERQSGVSAGDITENAAARTFTIPVTADKRIGQGEMVLRLYNGGVYKELAVKVLTDAAQAPNVLAGRTAILRHFNSDYSFNAEYTDLTTSGLTDGDVAKDACLEIEQPSSHRDDFRAIFEADNSWQVAKVKVNIPNGNKGTNDNDAAGYVNKEISIAVGNDLKSMTRVATFSDLTDVSEFEYILPSHRKCKYIAVICNLNPYFYPMLSEVEAYEQLSDAIANYEPIAVSSWNADVIAEGDPETTANFGLDYDNWVFYSSAFKAEGALAGDDAVINTNSGVAYQLADFNKNNAMVLKLNIDYTITLAEPAVYSSIRMLGAATYAEDKAVTVIVNYDDNTTEAEQQVVLPSWYTADGSEAVSHLGRVRNDRSYDLNDYVEPGTVDAEQKCSLHEVSVACDNSKRVNSLTLKATNSSSKRAVILGLIGEVAKSNAVEDAVADGIAGKVVEGYYNMQGIRVNQPAAGLYIVRFTDGTAAKVIIR